MAAVDDQGSADFDADDAWTTDGHRGRKCGLALAVVELGTATPLRRGGACDSWTCAKCWPRLARDLLSHLAAVASTASTLHYIRLPADDGHCARLAQQARCLGGVGRLRLQVDAFAHYWAGADIGGRLSPMVALAATDGLRLAVDVLEASVGASKQRAHFRGAWKRPPRVPRHLLAGISTSGIVRRAEDVFGEESFRLLRVELEVSKPPPPGITEHDTTRVWSAALERARREAAEDAAVRDDGWRRGADD